MKRLWKTVPPCMSDVLGFEAVLNESEGLGVIDDCGRYKPIGAGKGGRGGRGGFERGAKPEYGFGFGRGEGRGGRGGRGGGIRVVNSEIRNADVITGTEQKVLAACMEGVEQYQPKFVLLCHAPSSSMIGSDLEANAAQLRDRCGLPAAYVNVDGEKDWLYGAGVTLEAMGKLLLERRPLRRGTVNILGCNAIDWRPEALSAVEEWLTENGFQVLSVWGMKDTVERQRAAAGAEFNLVVGGAGLRLARYMSEEFGIPYIAGAPFGKGQCDRLLRRLRGDEPPRPPAEGEPTALVVGEQLTADAIRVALRDRGFAHVRVLSFYELDKVLAEPGDVKLSCEDDLAAELANPSVQLVLCDPDCKPLLRRPVRWIGLPNPEKQSLVSAVECFNMVGGALDTWLTSALNQEGGPA